jgi:uncharacterized membrane protein
MRIIRIIISLLAVVAIVQSCSTDELASLSNVEASDVNYTDHIFPVISSYCICCHSGSSPAAGIGLESYADVVKHMSEGNMHTRINDGENPMPPGELIPPRYREIFKNWSDNQFKAR